ncbi:MAG: hypothetical protein IKU71_06685 [Kiritimatiellae bacterium]|nr:hypothetical protein [Kiritimatiellia bacterium]
MPKALLIVEGARLEPRFFSRLADVLNMRVEIVPFCANIYQLYRKLEEYGFNYDVKQALLEQNPTDEARVVLSRKYAYTYLIFDCDAQDRGKMLNGVKNCELDEIVMSNYGLLKKMVAYFTDETDPDRGKLYVNYPMMESFRDADDFFDESYEQRMVDFANLDNYKEIVGIRKLAIRHIDNFSKDDICSLLHMNLCKLLYMVQNDWRLPDINQYMRIDVQNDVLAVQCGLGCKSLMHVINTSIFLPIDYFGKVL